MNRAALARVLVAAPVLARQDEDAAHRADRREVQRLNTRSPNGYAPSTAQRAPASQRAYQRAQEDYRRRLEDWRRRVAACEAGDYDACQ